MSWEYSCCIVVVIFIESDTNIELSFKNGKFLSCIEAEPEAGIGFEEFTEANQ